MRKIIFLLMRINGKNVLATLLFLNHAILYFIFIICLCGKYELIVIYKDNNMTNLI